MIKKIISVVIISLFCCLSFVNILAVTAADEVIVCAWGGESQDKMRETIFKDFEAATGIKVIDTSEPDTSRIKAMVQSGNVEWDVVVMPMDYFMDVGQENFVPIDYSLYSQEQLDGLYDASKHEYGVGESYFALINAYRTDKFPDGNHPKNWTEFWDVETFSGPRAMHAVGGVPNAALEAALLADGVAPEDLYPLDIDRAFASLDKIKPYVTKWWGSGAEVSQMLTDGEVYLAQSYNSRLTGLKEQGVPVEIEWTQGILYQDFWMILKGSPNTENAQKFIQFATQAETEAKYASVYAYGPTNEDAFKYISEERAATSVTNPEHVKQMIFNDDNWWAEHRSEVAERFAEWLLK